MPYATLLPDPAGVLQVGHGVARRSSSGRRLRATTVAALLAASLPLAGACPAAAEPIWTGPREPNLMPGQVIDGWTGLPIPCRCRYQGQTYKLGDVVCMSTHVGVVMTRCELFMNNTSWVPTREPCTISAAPGRAPALAMSAPAP